jgi:hypothetical protein
VAAMIGKNHETSAIFLPYSLNNRESVSIFFLSILHLLLNNLKNSFFKFKRIVNHESLMERWNLVGTLPHKTLLLPVIEIARLGPLFGSTANPISQK